MKESMEVGERVDVGGNDLLRETGLWKRMRESEKMAIVSLRVRRCGMAYRGSRFCGSL
jgi:hypothetical protein